jgi:hypothetical protein
MKFTKLLASSAAFAVAAFALGLAVNALTLPAFTVAAVAFLALIVAHDYAPRRLDYTATAITVAQAERLPYAA